ncbi:ABC transporter permease [Fulvivirgaceae bacterium BMA12]|uniref:ABC transporter permease n=1 Tax=Agaribacillus aureus TaxID=3051825 RepID=A0ABT8L0H6_9BACT|nr:ABC transporter permease [Fulvivirgaceae bacterium BMA12]
MLINYLKITFRNIKRQRFYALLNILGLAIGIASAVIIAMYVAHELSYDRFYTDHQNIYRINTVWKGPDGAQRYATTPPPLAKVISNEIPAVKAVTVLGKRGDFTFRPDHDFEKVFRETNVWQAGKDFFKVLNFGLLEGDPETALVAPRSVILPKSTAIRYFGQKAYDEKRILGRSLLGGGDGGSVSIITGIMEDQPANSHIQFDMLVPYRAGQVIDEFKDWSWNVLHTYILIDEVARGAGDLSEEFQNIIAKYTLPSMGYNAPEAYEQSGSSINYVLQPITDIHLTSHYLREMAPNGNINYVYTFIAIALFVIIIASVNFMNLSTAQSANRAKEVGVKKAMGIGRSFLIHQFLVESMVFAFIGLILAMGLVELLLKIFPDVLGMRFTYHPYMWPFWFFLLLGTFLLGLLAGVYPAFYLSSFQPIKVLSGKLSTGIKSKNLRHVLITFQLAVSVGMIICTLVVVKQVNYISNKSLGFKKENVIIIQNDREIDERRQEYKDYLGAKPGIEGVSFSTGIPGQTHFHMRDFVLPGQTADTGIRWYEGDDTYLGALNIALVDGRNFDRHRASDSSAVLLNEAAVKMMGLSDPVGKYLIKNIGAPDEERVQIVGVMKDFNFESFHHEIQPLVVEFLDNFVFKDYISIRVSGGNVQQSLAIVKEAWEVFEPNVPFNYSFLDEDFDRLFKSEMKLQQIFGIFTFLAIFIAGLGLVGLAAFVAENRKKEIGVRKVFGAGVMQILVLLSKSFAGMTALGFLIAAPLAYYLMNNWLQSFKYKTQISFDLFLAAGLFTALVVILTVSYQSVKTAVANPINSLKEE